MVPHPCKDEELKSMFCTTVSKKGWTQQRLSRLDSVGEELGWKDSMRANKHYATLIRLGQVRSTAGRAAYCEASDW